MGVTNQQIVDWLQQTVKSTEANTAAFVESTNKQTAAFTEAVERLIQNDNTHHEAFRNRLEDIVVAQAVIKAENKSNSDFRKQVGKYILIVILVPVGTLILNLILK
jgi:hypothetical protein